MTRLIRPRVASLPVVAGVAFLACGYGTDPESSDSALVPFETSNEDGNGEGSASEGSASEGSPSEGSASEGSASEPGGGGSGGSGVGTEGPPNPGGIDTAGAGGGASPGGGMGAGGEAMPAGDDATPGDEAMVEEPPPVTLPRPMGPCDIYGTEAPCVGAYSMVRALSSTYDGPLYQVRRGAPNPFQNTGTGGERQDIGILPNGFADAAAQDAFCGNQPCTVSVLYDQSGVGNDLTVAKAGCYQGTASEDDYETSATDVSLTVGGNSVYGLFMRPHEGYRNNDAVGTPEGEDQAGIYMVTAGSGTRPNPPPACCWNFGIASRDNCYGPTGMMNALFFGRAFWGEGQGNGPWFMGDFEAGVWAGGTAGGIGRADLGPFDVNNNNPAMTMDYAFGILKSAPNNYALRMGNAQQGNLTTAYDGPTPLAMSRWQMEGGIILGIGGDNSNSSQGTFFEGVITAGRPSNQLDEAVYRNVQAAGYGQ